MDFENAPPPIPPDDELLPAEPEDRDAAIRQALSSFWGFSTLRPLQNEAIEATLDGRDALVVLPTGGGKSLCYQLPPLLTRKLTVVISPLIALMQDQVDGLRLAGYPAAALHSGIDAEERGSIVRAVENGELRLLLVAPERLFGASFLEWLSSVGVGAFAIDEAHCISQWGHDFRPEYRRLRELRQRFPGVAFQAYTATATPRVRDDILAQLELRDAAVLIGTFDRPNLTYRVHPRVDRSAQIAEALGRHPPGTAAIVYCISRRDTESLATALCEQGIDAAAYHAGLDGERRAELSKKFRSEELAVVVATVAFGMGIDRGDVRLVAHASMPKSVEHYQQETGRAGRDGLPAECLLLYSGADAEKWRALQRRSAEESGVADSEALEAQLALLDHLHRLLHQHRCRHRAISEYFGQSYEPDNCGACDVCLGEYKPVDDAKIIAQKILSCVARCEQRFGARHVVDVLRGSRAQKIVQRGHHELSTFGLLKEHSAPRLMNFVDQLIDAGDLRRSVGEYPVLQLTDAAIEVLKGERDASLVESAAAAEAETKRQSSRGGGGSRRKVVELSEDERGLFEALRSMRRSVATELGVAPFVVFGDVTLEELSRVRPSDLDGLGAIRGIGSKRIETLGERLLEAIAAHCKEHDLSLDAQAPAPSRPRTPRNKATDSSNSRGKATEAHEMFEAGASIEDVMAATGRAESTVAGYLSDFIRDAQPESIAAWVDDATAQRVRSAMAQSEDGRLKPIFEALDGSVPYAAIRIVLAHAAAQ